MPADTQNKTAGGSRSTSSPATAAMTLALDKARLTRLAFFTGTLCLLFWRAIMQWLTYALDEDRQSYLILVPVISGYLIWIKRFDLRLDWKTSLVPSILLACAGAGVAALALSKTTWPAPVDRVSAQILALTLIFLAGCFFFVGAPIMRQLTFPLAFLFFSIPVPTFLGNWIEIFLQYTSAEAAYWLLSLTNVPMIRSGLNFTLPGIPLRVAQECSGYNSTFSLFMVSLVAGHLFLKSPGRRAALALAVIPLAIIRNGFRIMTIALLCVYVDPNMIDSYIHHHGGPIFFALSLVPFFTLLWWLRRSEVGKRNKMD